MHGLGQNQPRSQGIFVDDNENSPVLVTVDEPQPIRDVFSPRKPKNFSICNRNSVDPLNDHYP